MRIGVCRPRASNLRSRLLDATGTYCQLRIVLIRTDNAVQYFKLKKKVGVYNLLRYDLFVGAWKWVIVSRWPRG